MEKHLSEDTCDPTQRSWRCFHCGETFHAPVEAGIHFGWTQGAETACRLNKSERKLAGTVRYLEAQLARYQSEDSDKDREFHAMQARHSVALREAEQRGYDRGMADMREQGYRLVEERERPDLYNATVST